MNILLYKGAFKTSLIKILNVEANNPSLVLRRNKLGVRFIYKLKSNTSYTESLNKLGESNNKSYEENERATKPMEVNLRKVEQRYLEEQKEIETKHSNFSLL